MQTDRMTLSDFLLARIGEDERAIRSLSEHVELDVGVRHAIAQCEARRRIVQMHARTTHMCDVCANPAGPDVYGDRASLPCDTLRLLALPYADHPDYRDEWQPTG